MSNPERLQPRWLKLLFILCVTVLVISGFGQMPIFKRYYIADIPGMAWTADFYLTHKLHYIAGAYLLFYVFYLLARYLAQWARSHRITLWGKLRIAIYAALILTGAMRVLKNLPNFSWTPTTTMLIDWTHLALALLLGLTALTATLTGHSPYLRKKLQE